MLTQVVAETIATHDRKTVEIHHSHGKREKKKKKSTDNSNVYPGDRGKGNRVEIHSRARVTFIVGKSSLAV